MAKIKICVAPRLVKRELNKEFEENKKAQFPTDYLVIHQEDKNKDDSGENLYIVWVYKQIGGYPIRGEKDLKEVLTYLKKHNSKKRPHHIQLLDADALEQKKK